jgi:hypothetical protein
VYPRGCSNPPCQDPAQKKGDTALEQKSRTQTSPSSHLWDRLETFVREQGQRFLQAL